MTLRQYEAFLKTVACASVSAAARELGVPQSEITKSGGASKIIVGTNKDSL